MTFANEKKTFLAKADKSKKGSIDIRIIPLLESINAHPRLYTTSSCSGRAYFWCGSGRKNETEWLRVSHDPVTSSFLEGFQREGTIWLRFESSILHVACDGMETANQLLDAVRGLYKKSAILSARNKIIVEIKGGEILEMPFYQDGKLLFAGDVEWLTMLVNQKLETNWRRLDQVREKIKSISENGGKEKVRKKLLSLHYHDGGSQHGRDEDQHN